MYYGDQLGATFNAQTVRQKSAVGRHVRLTEYRLAEPQPFTFVLDSQLDLAIARGETAVWHDRGVGCTGALRILDGLHAGGDDPLHVLLAGDQAGCRHQHHPVDTCGMPKRDRGGDPRAE